VEEVDPDQFAFYLAVTLACAQAFVDESMIRWKSGWPLTSRTVCSQARLVLRDRHRVASLRQRESSLKRTFHLLDELRDIVQRKSRF